MAAKTCGALNGNANRLGISSLISGLSIPNGSTFWIRWSDFNVTGSDDGLAIDDFSLTAHGSLAPVPDDLPAGWAAISLFLTLMIGRKFGLAA